MIEKVIFIGDPFRGEQAENVYKIRALFSSVLRQLRVFDQVCITEINKSLDRDLWMPVWKESLKSYPNNFSASIDINGSAVIGFEVPEAELNYLSEKGVPWVNLSIHPLRFLDDLYFDIATSFAFDSQKVAASHGLIDFCANLFAKNKKSKSSEPLPKTLLVCGQHWFDRSIYFDGGFRCLDYYISQIDSLVLEFDQVLYKPHPFWMPEKIAELMRVRYQARDCVDENIYELFSSGNIHTAAAISSSILTEAPYFGIQSVFLEPRAKRYGPAISYRALLDNSEFWEEGLLGRKNSKKSFDISKGVPPNYLRRVFTSWGFVTDESRLESRVSTLEQQVRVVEAPAPEGGQRAAAAEAKALEHDQRAAAAEAKALEHDQRAAAAEAKALEHNQRAAAADAKALEQQKRIDELGGNVHYWWQQARAVEAECNALRQSASWRITAPLRFATDLAARPIHTLRAGVNAIIHRAICITERPLSRLIAVVLRRPRLSRRINLWLLRYPPLHQQLIGVAHRRGMVTGASVYTAAGYSKNVKNKITSRGERKIEASKFFYLESADASEFKQIDAETALKAIRLELKKFRGEA